MAAIQEILEPQTWELAWQTVAKQDAAWLLVFKKSPICPTSHLAESKFMAWLNARPEDAQLKVMLVDVVNRRPISQRIAQDTGIRHESPQALLIAPGQRVIYQASHIGINPERIEQAYREGR